MTNIISNIRKRKNLIAVVNGVLIALMLYTPFTGYAKIYKQQHDYAVGTPFFTASAAISVACPAYSV
jgi:hypothetical protein